MLVEQFGDGVISRVGVAVRKYQCHHGVRCLNGARRNQSSKRYCLTAENVFELDGETTDDDTDTEGGDGPQTSIFNPHIKLEHQGNPRLVQHGLRTQTLPKSCIATRSKPQDCWESSANWSYDQTQEPSHTAQVGWQPAVEPANILLPHVIREKYP